MELQELKNRLIETKNNYLSQKGQLDNIKQEIKIKEEQKELLDKEIKTSTIKAKLIEDACSEAREQGKQFLENIASLGVASVFQDDTEVKLLLDEKSDSPVVDVKVTQCDVNGVKQFINPSFDGGGLNDILSLNFLISIASTVDDNYAPYSLDEPSKFVSKGDLANQFASHMKDIVTFTNKQIIMSTHDEAMLDIGDVLYNIVKDPVTKVSKVTKVF